MANKSLFAHAYAVVMAGGSGTRFWPLSRRKHPKQLLELFGHGTLLEQTVERLRPLIPPERIYIYTNELVLAEVRRRLPKIPRSQIVAEPASRNTAPTLGVAAHEICRRDPQGLMVVLPADHIIAKPEQNLDSVFVPICPVDTISAPGAKVTALLPLSQAVGGLKTWGETDIDAL